LPGDAGASGTDAVDALRLGLSELGWKEGRDYVFEVRRGDGTIDRMRELSAELKALKVDVIVTPGTIAIRAAHDGAPGTPIVMASGGDPVGAGFARSLAAPGGDITGYSLAGHEVITKQLELLNVAKPALGRVAVLMNPANPANDFFLARLVEAGRVLGLKIVRVDVADAASLDAAIERTAGGGLLVLREPLFVQLREQVAARAAAAGVPAVYADRRFVDAGGLMSFGPPFADVWRGAARYVDRILDGAKPGDLPIEQPTKFELFINGRTAKSLGLKIPQSLLISADKVIE